MTPRACLIVSSDSAMANGLASALSDGGLQTHVVTPGHGVIAAVSEHRPVAVVIDNDTFGGLLGEVMEALRLDPASEKLPIIALQSLVTPADREHARRLRLDGLYVRSPVAARDAITHVLNLI